MTWTNMSIRPGQTGRHISIIMLSMSFSLTCKSRTALLDLWFLESPRTCDQRSFRFPFDPFYEMHCDRDGHLEVCHSNTFHAIHKYFAWYTCGYKWYDLPSSQWHYTQCCGIGFVLTTFSHLFFWGEGNGYILRRLRPCQPALCLSDKERGIVRSNPEA